MPATNDYVSICGAMPAPNTMSFRYWLDDYKAKRRLDCVFKRTTTFYIDPVSGSDSNTKTQAQSPSTPWASLTNVRKALTGDGTTIGGAAGFSTPVTNTAFLFKRGTMIRDSTTTGGGCLVIQSAGIEIGAYGPMVAGSVTGEVKPVISNFTIQWLNGFTVTTPGGATNRRTISLTASATVLNPASVTRIGWLRVARGTSTALPSATSPYAPFTYCSGSAVSAGQDATAYAAVEATSYSFYKDSSGALSVNLGLLDPAFFNIATASSGTCLEATPGYNTNSLNYDGIRVGEGSDQCYIHDIIVEGYGCQCESFQNGSGIRVGNGAEDVCYLENVESYYNGRHTLSMECNATGTGYGGVLYKRGCKVGYCSPSGGANEDVAFANKGKHEFYNEDYTIRFGFLPANTTNTTLFASGTFTGAGAINKLGAFYGHSGGTGAGYNPVNLYVIENATILDERGKWPTATCGLAGFAFADASLGETPFLAGTDNDPTTYRAFVIGFKSPKYKMTTDVTASTSTRTKTIFINCHFCFDVAWTSPIYIWQAVSTALFINTIFEIDYEHTITVSNNLALALFQQNSARTINQRLLNCEIHVNGGDSNGYFAFCTNNFGQSSTWGIPIANTLILNQDNFAAAYATKALKIAYGAGGFSLVNCPANSSTYLRNNAICGALVNDISSGDGGQRASGWGASSGLVNLETAGIEIPSLPDDGVIDRPLGSTSPLKGAGSANPFADALTTLGMIAAPQYDFKWRRRPTTPSIGAFDVVSLESSSSSGGGSSNVAVGGCVRSPVRV